MHARPCCKSRSDVWVVIAVCSLLTLCACRRSEGEAPTQAGAEAFASVCAKCHGTDGKGGVPAAEGQNAPRNFCDSTFQAARTDEQLKEAIRKGKGNMPAFGNLFPDAELSVLVSKIRSFNPGVKGP